MVLQIVRIHEWYDESGPDDNESNYGDIIYDGPHLAIVDDDFGYGTGTHLFVDYFPPDSERRCMTYLNSADGDQYEIVPPEEWTDEMCQRIALLAMGVDDEDG